MRIGEEGDAAYRVFTPIRQNVAKAREQRADIENIGVLWDNDLPGTGAGRRGPRPRYRKVENEGVRFNRMPAGAFRYPA